jgi:hypothetical protein
MPFKCSSCRKTTNNLDTPPCGDNDCTKFRPVKIVITHFAYNDKGKKMIACINKVNDSVRSNHLLTTVNCPACLALVPKILNKKYGTPLPSEPEPKPVPKYLSELTKDVILIGTLQAAMMEPDQSYDLLSIEGLLKWKNDYGSFTTILGITPELDETLTILLKEKHAS